VTDLVTPIGWVDQTRGNAQHVLEREKFPDEQEVLRTHVKTAEGQDAPCVSEGQIRLELVMSVQGLVENLNPHRANPHHGGQRNRNRLSAWSTSWQN
jgi:hypothetical protein